MNIKTTEPALSAEQKNALELMLAGENVFLTGEAGTGKINHLARVPPKMRYQAYCISGSDWDCGFQYQGADYSQFLPIKAGSAVAGYY